MPHSTSRASASPSILAQAILFMLALPVVLAQFGGFFQGGFPFGGHQHQQEAIRKPDRQYKGWSEMESGTFRYLQLVIVQADAFGSALSRGLCLSRLPELRADSRRLPLPVPVSSGIGNLPFETGTSDNTLTPGLQRRYQVCASR